MNEYAILTGIMVAGSILPVWATVLPSLRAYKDAKRQDELWEEHQDKTGPNLPDAQKRAELRAAIQSFGANASDASLTALRGGVLLFLLLLEIVLLWHLTHHDAIATNTFWTMTGFGGAVLVLIGILVLRLSRDD